MSSISDNSQVTHHGHRPLGAVSRLRALSCTLSVALLLGLPLLCGVGLAAQTPESTPAPAAIPAPAATPAATGQQAPASAPAATAVSDDGTVAQIFGTVQAINGAVVPGATIELDSTDKTIHRTSVSAADGSFNFDHLAPATYILRASRAGMMMYTSEPMAVTAGQMKLMTQITLPINIGTTDVTVYASPEYLSQQQVTIALDQRVFGVVPNFYSTYDWNAPPMLARQKYKLALRSVVDPVDFAATALRAGVEQATGEYSGYGSGAPGYFRRFGAAYGDSTLTRLFGNAIYPSLFHQDPRYYYKGIGSKKARVWYAISRSVVARRDSGGWMVDYSHVLGSLTAGGLSYMYYPPKDRGVGLIFSNAGLSVAGQAADNLIREFVLKGITTRAKGN